MNFETYLRNTTESLSEPQAVGLAMYYLLEEEDNETVTASGVRDFLRCEPADVQDENVNRYPSQVKSSGWFKSNDGKYRLTLSGKEHYEQLVDLPSVEEQPREDSFLGEVEPPSPFYETLVNDIEQTYTHRVYDATLVLTRKLLENLIIDTLRAEYDNSERLTLFFDPDRSRHKSFSKLLDNFEEVGSELKRWGPELNDPEFHEQLQEFREQGNKAAHSITVGVDDEEIEELSSKARVTVPLLFRVQRQLQAAAQ